VARWVVVAAWSWLSWATAAPAARQSEKAIAAERVLRFIDWFPGVMQVIGNG
jgi:hypothetical protein